MLFYLFTHLTGDQLIGQVIDWCDLLWYADNSRSLGLLYWCKLLSHNDQTTKPWMFLLCL